MMLVWDQEAAGKVMILYETCEEIRETHGHYKLEFVIYHVNAGSETEGTAFFEWQKNNT